MLTAKLCCPLRTRKASLRTTLPVQTLRSAIPEQLLLEDLGVTMSHITYVTVFSLKIFRDSEGYLLHTTSWKFLSAPCTTTWRSIFLCLLQEQTFKVKSEAEFNIALIEWLNGINVATMFDTKHRKQPEVLWM